MRIKSIEALRKVLPAPVPKSKPWDRTKPLLPGTAAPVNFYPEFARGAAATPGAAGPELWVRVTAENGQWGLGNTHWGDITAPVVRHRMAPLLEGRDCMATEFLNDLMWRASQRIGAGGPIILAQSAIDVALWDLKGKLLGVPVYSLLGGPCRDSLECYITTADLEWAQELGFNAFKLPNPVHYTAGEDGLVRLEEHVARAREIVGPKAELMLNPIGSFNVEFAIRAMERLRPYHLRWFEEPLMPWDIEGLAEIKRAVPTMPIGTGESNRGRHAYRQMVEKRCVDVLQPDITWSGGLTETLKIYAIGEAAGIQTIPHLAGGQAVGQHFSLAMPEVLLTEYRLLSEPGIPLEEVCSVPGMPVPKNGKLVLSDAPGLGMEFRAEDFAPW